MPRFSQTLLLIACGAVTLSAQATRTWVSGVGDDANPCSRTAPCKTFAGAISKTAAGGEISALDPGGFGAVTITKSITLNGDGDLMSIVSSSTNGVVINAGSTDVVVIRSLSINGIHGQGLDGIKFIAGGRLVVENSSISGSSTSSSGINVALGGNGTVIVRNTSIEGGLAGVSVTDTTGRANVSLDRVSIHGTTNGIHGSSTNGFIEVSDSVIANNSGYAILADGGEISVENSMIAFNGVAVQANAGATIRISNNAFYNNQTGFACGAGTLASAGNNRKGSNVGGVVSVCAPNTTISVQ